MSTMKHFKPKKQVPDNGRFIRSNVVAERARSAQAHQGI